MTKDDIIRMAQEAGMPIDDDCFRFQATQERVTRFAALVAAAAVEREREACAKVCEELRFSALGPSTQAKFQRDLCAKAIRARGQA